MGWFVIACICGFVGYLGWRRLQDDARLIVTLFVFVMLALALVLWAWHAYRVETFGQVADALQDGRVARFLLGLVFGIGAAGVLAGLPRPTAGNGAGDDAARDGQPRLTSHSIVSSIPGAVVTIITSAPGTDAAPQGANVTAGDDSKTNLPTYLLAAIALGIVVLALFAPHLDDWLQRATALKSPYIELQLASTASHRISVSENIQAYYEVDALNYLTQYGDKIQSDVDYQTFVKASGRGDAKYARARDAYLGSTKELLPTFNMVITPVAKCVQAAINEGSLSIDSARDAIRPLASAVEQIILADSLQHDRKQLEQKSREFWLSVIDLPNKLHLLDCHAPYMCYEDIVCLDKLPIYLNSVSPVIQDHADLPYLYVAAALLISFTADDDRALQVLERFDGVEKKDGVTCGPDNETNCDYIYLWVLARLKYYQGRPGDIWHAYLEPLDRFTQIAQYRIAVLQSSGKQCKSDKDTDGKLLCRQEIAELIARDMRAYYIAEDLARGYEDAARHTVQLQEDVEEIKRLVDWSDSRRQQSSEQNPLDRELQDERDTYLDTYAFATLVLEARKPNPDFNMIRSNVIPTLNKAIHHFEDRAVLKERRSQQERHIDKRDLAQWRILQEHLVAAKEFVGER